MQIHALRLLYGALIEWHNVFSFNTMAMQSNAVQVHLNRIHWISVREGRAGL